ncbi:MAG: peptide chain release factor N(5)-glutamine methyltransferase [Bacteroidales bacterium]|nr:peptide chain release factor N(5)-glutamine methyltransferase [Bacteroidales bacterium]
MDIKAFTESFSASLSSLGWYDAREIRTMAAYILKEVAGIESYKIIVSPEQELGQTVSAILQDITAQMAKGRPMQYVLGYEYFCGDKFNVSEGVLIPRPETEEIVRYVIAEAEVNALGGDMRILDLCTGSGCIAWSLAWALPGSHVWGCDISERALDIAKSQKKGDEVAGRVNFFRCDLLAADAQETIAKAGEFDIVVSNPPYVCEGERSQMRPNVLDFEPEEALFVPDDEPLLFYERIAELSEGVLKEGGRLYFEVNERFGAEVASMLGRNGFSGCEVVKDMFGKERMVKAKKLKKTE